MASLREICRKIKSVKSTQQITKAMKMVAAALCLTVLSGSGLVADLAKGSEEYQKGRYGAAAHAVRQQAEEGSIDAEVILGGLYILGRGVPKDETLAAAWLLMAR